MELDAVQQKPPAAAQATGKPEKPEAKPKARSASQKPETSKPNKATKAQRAAGATFSRVGKELRVHAVQIPAAEFANNKGARFVVPRF